ncbi:MAG: ribonuclease III, partial [Oscillospiraceae bacterium]|nr:ribonuclease III [Oscillospiraceae bacterium]
EAVTPYILQFLPAKFDRPSEAFHDYKTVLQEVIQQNPEEHVEYVLVGEDGPDHAKLFHMEVRLNSNVIGRGSGKSKKIAEQMAAREALMLMGEQI